MLKYRVDNIGAMAALICALGPLLINLPFTAVPISLTNLAVYFVIYVAGTRRAVISYLIYLLLGMCGVPVFSNFSSGVQKLVGPTGGYLVGFILMAIVSGFFIDRWYNKPVIAFAGMWIGKFFSAAVGPILRRRLDKEGIVEYTKINNEDLSIIKMKG